MRVGLQIVTLLLLCTFVAQAAEVRLRSASGCAAAVVRVGDVAEVMGNDPRVAAALNEILLCPAPAAGRQRTLSQAEVQQLLSLSGVDRKAALVTGSESVTVTKESHSVGNSPKRPMVAAGIRQVIFEADSEAPAKAKTAVPIQNAAPGKAETKEPAAPPLVDRGTIVTVTARNGGIKVTASGKALEPGAMGETIGVEMVDGKQRILGRVSGPQAVDAGS